MAIFYGDGTNSSSGKTRVVQVVSNIKKDKDSFTLNNDTTHEYTNFYSPYITPKSTTNVLRISGIINITCNGGAQDISLILRKNGNSYVTDVIGDQGDSNQRRSTLNVQEDDHSHGSNSVGFSFLVSPNTTSQHRYNWLIFHSSGSQRVIYVNRSERDNNSLECGTYISTWIIEELAET